jgi:signal transduction histidine kinase
MGFAAIARVTEDRWICCASRDQINFGLGAGGELKIETTICNEIRQSGEGVIIDHVSNDAVYCGHPTPAMYGFQSYISLPIRRSDGSMFGTFCAIDPEPKRVNTPEVVGTFTLFAELIASQLDTMQRADEAELKLLNERRTAELREQFLAVLSHDLRNPLAAMSSGVRLLEKGAEPGSERYEILQLMGNAAQRMTSLINDLMDLARTRLGGLGLPTSPSTVQLAPVLEQVVNELRASHPSRVVELDLRIPREVHCDAARIGQLFSNLLGNAVAHGSKDHPVRVTAGINGLALELSVSNANAGEPIPDHVMARLFEPFARGPQRHSEGLGLGLYIASEIAKAHGGTLQASSTALETRFTFPHADREWERVRPRVACCLFHPLTRSHAHDVRTVQSSRHLVAGSCRFALLSR